jgi:hypothetical protein
VWAEYSDGVAFERVAKSRNQADPAEASASGGRRGTVKRKKRIYMYIKEGWNTAAHKSFTSENIKNLY